MGKKLWRHRSFSFTCFCYYRKHPNNDNEICPLPSSSGFQQHFHDCWNLNDYYYYLIENVIWKLQLCDLKNRRKLFSIPVAEYAYFSHQDRTLKTNLLCLTSNFSKYFFKTGITCLLFLSSHVFTALEFDNNHFGFLPWKILKPRDHNEIKPLLGKIIRKYCEAPKIIVVLICKQCLQQL